MFLSECAGSCASVILPLSSDDIQRLPFEFRMRLNPVKAMFGEGEHPIAVSPVVRGLHPRLIKQIDVDAEIGLP